LAWLELVEADGDVSDCAEDEHCDGNAVEVAVEDDDVGAAEWACADGGWGSGASEVVLVGWVSALFVAGVKGFEVCGVCVLQFSAGFEEGCDAWCFADGSPGCIGIVCYE
jgi:hypothetical protein